MASEETKQVKIVGFYVTIVLVALGFGWYKACESGCDPNCRDEFIPANPMGSAPQQCSAGASAEAVTEPAKGILCHCNKRNLVK